LTPRTRAPRLPLAALAPDDRPREKLLRASAAALSDAELVAVVLGSGVRGRDALAVAAELLDASGGVGGLAALPAVRLTRAAGVGSSRAARLLAAIELGRRAVSGPRAARPRVASPAAAAEYLLPRVGRLREEHFGLLLLDTRHRLIRAVMVSVGSLDASLVHPREVFRAAAEHSAAAIVLFHNHPSGDPAPSAEDLTLTRRLVQAGELMGIGVVDHVVLGDGCWHSVRESAPAVFAR
jgi:DNA repair protein RadC